MGRNGQRTSLVRDTLVLVKVGNGTVRNNEDVRDSILFPWGKMELCEN
jgi:hypothetical protein